MPVLNKYVIAGIVILVLAIGSFGAGWYTGRAGLEKQIAEAQTKQLQKDAKESVKIEDRADAREEKTEREVEAIRQTDWAKQPLPADVIKRLRERQLAPG